MTEAALDILRQGGSVVDAGAVLTVVMPTAGALGGDVHKILGENYLRVCRSGGVRVVHPNARRVFEAVGTPDTVFPIRPEDLL